MMDDVGDHFLAHAALAGDEHIRFRWRHRVDKLLDLLHCLALEYRGESRFRDLEPLLQLLRFLAQLFRLAKQRLFFQRLLHQAK